MNKEEDRHVQSLVAALSIVDAFDGDVSLRLKELHERTGLNRSRILRFAGTLRACGYLSYDPDTAAYSLGPRLHAIGWMLQRSQNRVLDFVRPALKRLMTVTGDTAFYSSIHNDVRLVLAKHESNEGLRFIVEEGQTRPLHTGASSKVLLAFASGTLRSRVLAQLEAEGFEDGEALVRELDAILETGHSVSRGEVTPHGFAVAVPVRNGTDFPDVLTLAGPITKLTLERTSEYVNRLEEEALRLEEEHAALRAGTGLSPDISANKKERYENDAV